MLWNRYGFEIPEVQHVDKAWGGEVIIVDFKDAVFRSKEIAGYTGKILTAAPNGQACSIHWHKLKTETFHVLQGNLHLELWSRRQQLVPPDVGWLPESGDLRRDILFFLRPGQSITLRAGQLHRFWCASAEPAKFIEFSTPDDPSDSYRAVLSGPAPTVAEGEACDIVDSRYELLCDYSAGDSSLRILYAPTVPAALEEAVDIIRRLDGGHEAAAGRRVTLTGAQGRVWDLESLLQGSGA